MITLPLDWQVYYNSIIDRCKDFIDLKIWNGITKIKLDIWLRNFITDEEKYFAACILDSLIYRSNEQTFSLIHQLLYKNLNNLFRELGLNDFQCFPENLKDHNADPLIRLVPLITLHDPVTKSSNEILRFFKRHFHISECWIINPWNINAHIANGIKTFIFIDDFLGTGRQFHDVCEDENLSSIIDNNNIVYAPLVAHETGIDFLKKNYPKLNITYAEKMVSEQNSFFNNYFNNEVDIAKAFYLEMLTKRGFIFNPDNQFGFGNLELTFAFEHAAPDNSLQVLHMRKDGWCELFNR